MPNCFIATGVFRKSQKLNDNYCVYFESKFVSTCNLKLIFSFETFRKRFIQENKISDRISRRNKTFETLKFPIDKFYDGKIDRQTFPK